MAPVSLLQRPLSAPTSLESSSSRGSSAPQHATAIQPEHNGVDVDASIVEALKSSKDRIYVLKLGETMESLISQGTLYAKVDLQPASSYQRLLVHRCAAFYHLTQESSQNSVSVIVTADSRM
jgi:UDP-N-acetyl-D-mannosaminuronate dehydrogenase